MNHARRRNRLRYVVALGVTIAAGLLSRSSAANHLPELVRVYAGDTLWALAVFLVLGLLFPKAGTMSLAVCAAMISYGVELSQLYRAPWIDALRRTIPGTLLLGFGFQWSDLICYSAGILLGAAAESAGAQRASPTVPQSTRSPHSP